MHILKTNVMGNVDIEQEVDDGEIDDWDMWEQDIRIALNDIFDDE